MGRGIERDLLLFPSRLLLLLFLLFLLEDQGSASKEGTVNTKRYPVCELSLNKKANEKMKMFSLFHRVRRSSFCRESLENSIKTHLPCKSPFTMVILITLLLSYIFITQQIIRELKQQTREERSKA